MRLTRAFVASAGAGMSIVAAAVAGLFLLSTVVALQGWPGIDPDNDVPRLVLSDVPPAGAVAGATPAGAPADAAAVAPVAAPIILGGGDATGPAASGRRGAAATPGGAADDGPVTGGAPSRTPAPAPAGTPAPAGGGGTAPAGGNAAGSTPPSGLGPAVQQVTDGAGQTVGGAVDRVVPGAGDTVTGVTDAVGGAVPEGGRAVDGLLAP